MRTHMHWLVSRFKTIDCISTSLWRNSWPWGPFADALSLHPSKQTERRTFLIMDNAHCKRETQLYFQSYWHLWSKSALWVKKRAKKEGNNANFSEKISIFLCKKNLILKILIEFAFLKSCVLSMEILEATYVVTFCIFAFAMQILFFFATMVHWQM